MLPERERHGVAEQRAPEAQPALHQPLAGPADPELHQVRCVHQRALERGGLLVARAEVLEPDGELLVAPQPIQRMRHQLARVGEEDQARRGRGTPGERPNLLRFRAGLGSGLRRLQRLEREPDQPLPAEGIERPTEGISSPPWPATVDSFVSPRPPAPPQRRARRPAPRRTAPPARHGARQRNPAHRPAPAVRAGGARRSRSRGARRARCATHRERTRNAPGAPRAAGPPPPARRRPRAAPRRAPGPPAPPAPRDLPPGRGR